MDMMQTPRNILATLSCTLLSAGASAVTLNEPVGSFEDFALAGTTVAARPELAGTILEDNLMTYAFDGAGETLEGTIQQRVVRSIDGTLDFYWRIIGTGGTGDLLAFRVSGFDGYTLDADWRVDGLGSIAPDIARYFGSVAGSVNFLFESNEIGAGEASRFFFLDTQATHYDMSGEFDFLCAANDCFSGIYSTFAPAAVPVPAALWLLGSGLIGLAGISRRRPG